LADNSIHFNHFTGFMMEEEIASSLWDFVLKCVNWSSSDRNTLLMSGNFFEKIVSVLTNTQLKLK
jgi:hypothetical protein